MMENPNAKAQMTNKCQSSNVKWVFCLAFGFWI